MKFLNIDEFSSDLSKMDGLNKLRLSDRVQSFPLDSIIESEGENELSDYEVTV